MQKFIAKFCSDEALSGVDELRMVLIVEELFTNTVVHGHAGGSDTPVRLGLSADASHLELTYEDSAAAFDLLGHAAGSAIDLGVGLVDRPVGQLGIPLIVNMAERIGYSRENGCNRIRLALRRLAAVSTPADPA